MEALTQTEGELDNSAPEANAYEFQSQGIVDMLQKLLDKFIEERTTLEKEESDSRHAFEMLTQDLGNEIEHMTAAREEASATKAKKLQAKAVQRARSKTQLRHVTMTRSIWKTW